MWRKVKPSLGGYLVCSLGDRGRQGTTEEAEKERRKKGWEGGNKRSSSEWNVKKIKKISHAFFSFSFVMTQGTTSGDGLRRRIAKIRNLRREFV